MSQCLELPRTTRVYECIGNTDFRNGFGLSLRLHEVPEGRITLVQACELTQRSSGPEHSAPASSEEVVGTSAPKAPSVDVVLAQVVPVEVGGTKISKYFLANW